MPATLDTFTVKFDPSSQTPQAQVISGATLQQAGVMTAAQVQQLNALVSGEQTAVLVFDGTQDFVDHPWPTIYTNFVLSSCVSAAGGAVVPVNFTKLGDSSLAVDNTGVRAVPTVPFTGVVYVTYKKA